MNQRREARFETDASVAITLFGEPDVRLSAHIRNISGRGVGLEFAEPVAIGTALKIELPDSLLLGEVIYCRKDVASFYVGVELEHALNGLAELSRAVAAFAEFAEPVNSSPKGADAVVDGGQQREQQSR